MTLFEAYQSGLKQLKNPEKDEINLRILLCDINGLETMSDFYLKKDEKVRDLHKFNRDLLKFLNGEPIQYILGKASFFGDEFLVTKDVLIPRNETEEVVDFAIRKIKDNFRSKKVEISDVCTGSGCIGCELYKHVDTKCVNFSDISEKALGIAEKNAQKFGVLGNFYVSDGLDYLDHKVDVVISNPPYILNKEDVVRSVLDYEPHLALFIDEELTIYKKIISKAVQLNVPLIIFEIGYDLVEKLTNIVNKYASLYKVEFKKDINNKFRICSLEKI